MYCRHCGKEIDSNSTFCKYCGKSQGNQQVSFKNPEWWIFYLIWVFANMYLLMGVKNEYVEATERFFPFTKIFLENDWYGNRVPGHYVGNYFDRNYYDFSEFLVYVFIIPIIGILLYKVQKKWSHKTLNYNILETVKSSISSFFSNSSSGKLNRRTYWFAYFFGIILLVVIILEMQGTTLTNILKGVVWVPVLYVVISLCRIGVKRLHDIGKTGKYMFLLLIPIFGWIYLFYLHCLPSQEQNGTQNEQSNL